MEAFACLTLVEGVCQAWQPIATSVMDPAMATTAGVVGFGSVFAWWLFGIAMGFIFKAVGA